MIITTTIIACEVIEQNLAIVEAELTTTYGRYVDGPDGEQVWCPTVHGLASLCDSFSNLTDDRDVWTLAYSLKGLLQSNPQEFENRLGEVEDMLLEALSHGAEWHQQAAQVKLGEQIGIGYANLFVATARKLAVYEKILADTPWGTDKWTAWESAVRRLRVQTEWFFNERLEGRAASYFSARRAGDPGFVLECAACGQKALEKIQRIRRCLAEIREAAAQVEG